MIFHEAMTFTNKIRHLNRPIIGLVTLLSFIGFFVLYSAGGGNFSPWAASQMGKFAMGFLLMIGIAIVDVRHLMKWAYSVYGVAFILLILVHIFGLIGMGAQRWINLGFIRLQPSEIMKLGLVLTLACYYHRLSLEEIQSPRYLVIPIFLILLPAFLVLKQPDLGTTALLVIIGIGLLFAAGVQLWYFGGLFGMAVAAMPIAWQFLHGYQKKRILTFLDPTQDPLGSGYHILQSKIAIGSGGIFGKGFLKGTQGHLNFLPEKQTDFIFTMFCEEFGFFGAIILLALYGFLLFHCLIVSLACRSFFTKLVSFGITLSLFVYIFINMAMVLGLVPVVGVPLPFVSYGGTSLITLLIGVGLLLNADLNQDSRLLRYE